MCCPQITTSLRPWADVLFPRKVIPCSWERRLGPVTKRKPLASGCGFFRRFHHGRSVWIGKYGLRFDSPRCGDAWQQASLLVCGVARGSRAGKTLGGLGRYSNTNLLPACANSLGKVEVPHIAEHSVPRSVRSRSANCRSRTSSETIDPTADRCLVEHFAIHLLGFDLLGGRIHKLIILPERGLLAR